MQQLERGGPSTHAVKHASKCMLASIVGPLKYIQDLCEHKEDANGVNVRYLSCLWREVHLDGSGTMMDDMTLIARVSRIENGVNGTRVYATSFGRRW